jgi:hypothetical protein
VSLPLTRDEVKTLCDAISTTAAFEYVTKHGWEIDSGASRTRFNGVVVHWLTYPGAPADIVMQDGEPRFADASARIDDAIQACARAERRCECAIMLEMLAASLAEAAHKECGGE